MPTFDQKNRLLAITTTLADDTILLTSFSGSEELSKPFVFHLQGVSTNLAIAPADIVGQKITVSVQWQQFDPGSGENTGKVRYFNGYVGRYSAGGLVGADSTRAYQFEMVSWLWFLTLQSGCRIYQAMTVPDIVQQVFSDAGFTDVKNSLQGTYPTLDFCVQYRETHFDFVSRLMEQAGIFYFFQHTDDKHTLVLADDISAYTACPDAKVEFSELYGGSSMGFVNSWGRRYSLIPGKYSHTDYNFETPDTSLVNSTPTVVSLSGLSKYELYDFPGFFAKGDDGKMLADRRMQEREVAYEMVSGASTYPGFSAGIKFKLADYPVDAENGVDLAIVSVEHAAHNSMGLAGPDQTEEYSNTFSAIPATVVFRPPRTTRLPAVSGPQTAVVVGASGDEITTDKYGRVKVQFFWDRLGKNDDKSSCFVRVAQAWGGKNWGVMFTPRVGDEVIVDFLEGNPDRPIIIGSVYNADNLPPYQLAKDDGSPGDELNYSGIKTFSTTGGTAGNNFNELRFKDDKGKEEVYFHAERDFTRIVENDDILKVGLDAKDKGDQTIIIHNNQTITIGNDKSDDGSQTTKVFKDQTITIGNNQKLNVGDSNSADGSQTIAIYKDQKVTIGNNQQLDIGDANSADGSQTVNIYKARTVTLKTGDDALTVTQGNHTVQIKAGASSLEAMQSIVLKVGDNSIKIAPDGITIKGTLIDIQGSLGFKAKGLTADVIADAMLTLKGGLLKHN